MEHHVYFWLKEEKKNAADQALFEQGLADLFKIKEVAGGRWGKRSGRIHCRQSTPEHFSGRYHISDQLGWGKDQGPTRDDAKKNQFPTGIIHLSSTTKLSLFDDYSTPHLV